MTMSEEDKLAEEAAELDGYFSDTPLDPQPNYPPLNERFDSAIVITNLPKVPESKLEKLTKVVMKLVSRIGTLAAHAETNFTGMEMPFDAATGSSVGFCFVDYTSPEEARNAVEVLEGYKFDKNHALQVCLYSQALKLKQLDSMEYREPELPPFVEKPNATAWLEDPNQRDEFVTRFARETCVYWFDAKNDPVLDYDGAREKEAGVAWCEYYCHWSPKGTYLATLVPSKGVILWSGKTWEKTGRFVAPDVKLILFSPQETYLLTNNERREDPAAIKIYNIATGQLLRTFGLYPDNYLESQQQALQALQQQNPDGGGGNIMLPPPPFLWSHDDQYLARMGAGLISIFETPTMRLLDKKSLLATDIHEFQWSPNANIIAYWAPERDNAPAHVDLIEIPSRKKLRQKNLFNVTKCNMVWQNEGEYLAVKVTRHTKSKKTLYNNIELFRLNESGIPVEMLDIKDAVMALAFEPRGSRFAMIHAENPSSTKVNVSFYDMMKQGDPILIGGGNSKRGGGGASQKKNQHQQLPEKHPELHKVEMLEGRQCTGIFWSPAGSNIILASLGDSASGTLEFYNVDEKTMVMKEHYRANHVAWDPAGRTVATIVSQPIEGGHFKFAMDNGYILWSFQGKQLFQKSFEAFYQFLWRPRETLLSKKEIDNVQKNLKKYEKQFDKADKERQRALYLEETKGKRMERARYRETLARNKAILERRRAEYIALLDGYDSEDESNYTIREVQVETVLSTKEELIM